MNRKIRYKFLSEFDKYFQINENKFDKYFRILKI
jgi:hypothetical protein